MVHATCAALNCLSSSHTHKHLKFHQFPHNAERRKIWINACKRTDVIDKDWNFFKHKYVCGLHFQKCMYSKKDRLKKSAIPSINLSDKPIQHDSSTQTWESIQYVRPQQNLQGNNAMDDVTSQNVSIIYVMPNMKKSFTTSYTQTENSLPYDFHHVDIKEEKITDTEVEDFEEFEQDEEVKTEIVENEILPRVQSPQPLQFVDPEKEITENVTQTENPLQDIEQGIKVSTILNLKRKIDESIQTDKAIVLNKDGKEQSIISEDCECNKRDPFVKYADGMTRLQFYKACSRFLSDDFSNIVKKQMRLDDLTKQIARNIVKNTVPPPRKRKKKAYYNIPSAYERVQASATECVGAEMATCAEADGVAITFDTPSTSATNN